jgi:nuclear transport factor 2 (NTF2) superfamily protein
MSTTLTHLGAATLTEQIEKEHDKPPLPPFTRETAILKIRMAEDAWNSQDPNKVKMAYTQDTLWRNRSTFLVGRDQVRDFLDGKWDRELNYKLIKELWAYTDNKIAVRFCYEFHNQDGQWFRAHGNENWEFASDGRMAVRHASINDVLIDESHRKFRWEGQATHRPMDHPGLTELGL